MRADIPKRRVLITVRVQRVRGAESRAELQMVIMGHRGRRESGSPRVCCDAAGGRYSAGDMLVSR